MKTFDSSAKVSAEGEAGKPPGTTCAVPHIFLWLPGLNIVLAAYTRVNIDVTTKPLSEASRAGFIC
jgi:hypothetical protein